MSTHFAHIQKVKELKDRHEVCAEIKATLGNTGVGNHPRWVVDVIDDGELQVRSVKHRVAVAKILISDTARISQLILLATTEQILAHYHVFQMVVGATKQFLPSGHEKPSITIDKKTKSITIKRSDGEVGPYFQGMTLIS